MKCRNCHAECLGGYCSKCEFMTIREAYTRLHVSRSTFFRLLRAKRFRLVKPSNRRTLICRAEVEALLTK